jgi:hypothetical protein
MPPEQENDMDISSYVYLARDAHQHAMSAKRVGDLQKRASLLAWRDRWMLKARTLKNA